MKRLSAPVKAGVANSLLPEVQPVFRVKLMCLGGILAFVWVIRLWVSPATLATEVTLAAMIAIVPAVWIAVASTKPPQLWVAFALICDLVALTLAIHFGGGVDQTSGPILYAVAILLGGMLLSERAAMVLTAVAIGLYATMVAAEYFRWLPHRVAYSRPPDRQLATVLMVGIYLAVFGWLVAYVVRLMQRARALAQEVRADAVRSLAHDLKNALFAISGYADMITAESQPTSRAHAQRIGFLASETAALLTNMIDATSAEARPLIVREETVAPAELLRKVQRWFDGAASDLGVTITVSATDAPKFCLADGALLERALNNLVNNALRHTSTGGHIELGCRAEDESIVWWVRDTGQGIHPDLVRRIFGPFVSGVSSPTAGQHSGLGLYIVQRIAEAHGGEASVESVLGRGSCFTIRFPLRLPQVSLP